MSKTQSEIQRLIDAVDAKTMGNIEKILKGMSRKSDGDESPGDKAMMSKSKMDMEKAKKNKAMKMKKGKDGDMAPGMMSQAIGKDDGAENQVGTHGPGLSDRAQAALKATARILAPFKDEISDDHLDAIQREVGIHTPTMDEATPSDDDEGSGDMDGAHKEDVEMSVAYPEGVEEEHHSSALDMAKKAYMGHLEKMGYRKYPDEDTSESAATKSADGDDADDGDDEEGGESVGKVQKTAGALDLSAFPVGQRAQLEAIFKANNDLVQVNKSLVEKTGNLEKQLKEERDIRVLKGFEEKARGFKHLGANSHELAVVMKSLAESDPKGYEKVESILKAADEQVRVAGSSGAGLFGEIGTRHSGSGGGPGDKLEALVDSVVAKSGDKTREQVYEEVLKTAEGKRLYAEYKSARPHGI